MTPEQFIEWTTSVPWTFAKTMPKDPHWWTTIKTCNHVLWRIVTLYIEQNGQEVTYKGRYYHAYLSGEYRYWTMENDYRDSVLINRALEADCK